MQRPLVRKASLDDVPELVKLHLQNVSKREFSMLLPPEFLKPFYRLCVLDANSSAYVLLNNLKIVGVSIVWSHHNLLTRRYQSRIALKLLLYLLKLILTLQIERFLSILAYIFERRVTKIPDDVVANCVEMTILDKASRSQPIVITAFFRMFSENVELLKINGNGNIWASASASNTASIRMIKNVVRPNQILHFRNRPEKSICFLHYREIA